MNSLNLEDAPRHLALSLSEPWGQNRILGYLRGLSEVGQNLSNAYHWCTLMLGFVNDTGEKKENEFIM